MNPTPGINRRDLLAASLAAAALPAQADAAAAPANRQAAGFYRHRLGSFELTAVYDGYWFRPIDWTFVPDTPYGEVTRALDRALMPPDRLTVPFTALVVNTGTKLVLIDTGTAGQLAPTAGVLDHNLAAAGIDRAAIDVIVISHFHPDHINNIKDKNNTLTFPNAEVFVPRLEWAYWMNDGNLKNATATIHGQMLNARRVLADMAKTVRPYDAGEIVPGITAIEAFGHTPGHMVFAIASGGQSMLVLGDTTNNPLIFARHPEWQPVVDHDGPMAVATRRRLLDRAAADRMLVQGFHFPFPAAGHIVRDGTGYEFVPMIWQPAL